MIMIQPIRLRLHKDSRSMPTKAMDCLCLCSFFFSFKTATNCLQFFLPLKQAIVLCLACRQQPCGFGANQDIWNTFCCPPFISSKRKEDISACCSQRPNETKAHHNNGFVHLAEVVTFDSKSTSVLATNTCSLGFPAFRKECSLEFCRPRQKPELVCTLLHVITYRGKLVTLILFVWLVAGGLMLICSKKKNLLREKNPWWLVRSERNILLAGG